MIRRASLIAAAALATTAAAPPMPATLAPYVHDGHLDPDDYGWMRGAFADATPAQKAEWKAIGAWHRQCEAPRLDATRKMLRERGIEPPATLAVAGEGACGELGFAMAAQGAATSWTGFQVTLTKARPIAQAVIWSAALAQAVADPDHATETTLLVARPMTDQVLRRSLSWRDGPIVGAPPLDKDALNIVHALVGIALVRRDRDNTTWLKSLVAKDGWPSIPKVGAEASADAWLLAQHADDDPVFQLDMLRLMEPLAARGEVTKKDYAYLYDRVMLKLAGKQRYGSQFTCVGGRHTPLPLEDAARVDALRRDMAMETVAQNVARMDRMYGPCAPDVIPPSPAKR